MPSPYSAGGEPHVAAVGLEPTARWTLGRRRVRQRLCESFFATLECELLDRSRFQTQVEARMAVFEYLEGRYNPHRRHSAFDYLSPINYERSQLPAH